MKDMHGRRVRPLRELDDYEVADDNPDVRGWNVRTADGIEIGEVEELLVEPEARKVRYLAVDLRDADDRDRRVLVPIGAARLRRDDNDVVVEGLSAVDLRALPPYTAESFDERYENDVRQRFAADARDTGARYDHDIYDDRRFYGAAR